MKLVLHTSDSIAQKKLMEVPDLDLPAAMQILDTYDSLQKTTNALTENDFNAIGRIAKQPVTQTSSVHRSTLSIRVEYVHAAVTCMIPCVNVLRKDNFIVFAVVLVILRKCASKRIGGRQLTPCHQKSMKQKPNREQ